MQQSPYEKVNKIELRARSKSNFKVKNDGEGECQNRYYIDHFILRCNKEQQAYAINGLKRPRIVIFSTLIPP